MRFKNRVKETWKELFSEITVFEYVLFWIARLMLLCAVIFAKDNAYRTLDSLNMLACYTMAILRFVAPRKTFLSRLDFRIQHLINILEVLGTFGGHLLSAYNYIPKYDRWLHLLSGPLVVIAGYYFYKAFETKEGKENYRLNPMTATYSACSFSFVVITLWEIQEFISDFFIGSQNQGYYYGPAEDDIWFKVFGRGNTGNAQFPLWDTMMDMIDAAVTTIITAVILYFVLVFVKKRQETQCKKAQREAAAEECRV